MLPYLALSLAMLLWASAFIALKTVFAVFDPVFVLFCRMVIATLCMLPFLLGRGDRWKYRKGDWKWLLLMGMCEPCLYFLFEANALLRTSASQASMITSTLPLLVAVGAHFLLRERQSPLVWVGLSLSVSGVIWLTSGSEPDASAPAPVLGNFLEFMAMICATGYVLIAKKLSTRFSALAITATQTVLGAAWFGVILLTPWAHLPTHYPPTAVAWVLYLGVCVTLGAYGIYTWAVSRVPVALAGSFINLIPVFTLGMAASMLGERLSTPQWLAGVLVLLGVFISQAKRWPQRQVHKN
ncbi:DMT family transporter [Vogesella sp. LIG4]|uniref:DMT family transporter n=1 Tax=Vogesella sp. LIG4 TaxID=1192162 RepID=UPI00081F949C|nr:DMT family transporter [Vogesella sp. LIG4]SCK12139.1 Permease of the drug/metabolite transporter (DMT) superfamily [Vogesella sp. LIG4]